jgi:hypothetical protein
MPPALKSAVIVVGGGIAALMIFGWPANMLVTPIVLALLLVGLCAFVDLIRGNSGTNRRLWLRAVSLLGIIGLLYLFTITHVSAHLADLRTRAVVTRTGGSQQLQSWAAHVISDSRRPHLESSSLRWDVPKEQWSEQVRRLAPNRVFVDWAVFQGSAEALYLVFGGGVSESRIVVGSPGAGRVADHVRYLGHWFRWTDGLYGLYRESAYP